jgi:transcriptional regulator with XRE-family HTH domain
MTRTTGGTPKARALGAELREAREAAGRSLRALAQELDTNHVRLMRYETGKTVPPPEVVAAFVTALGVSAIERDRLVEMARERFGAPSRFPASFLETGSAPSTAGTDQLMVARVKGRTAGAPARRSRRLTTVMVQPVSA